MLAPARFCQRLGLGRLATFLQLHWLLPRQLRRLAALLPPPVKGGPALPEFLPAKGRRRARVALFTGCVADVLFRHTNWATARVLQQNGCDVVVPRGQVCCGAIHFHAGDSEGARHLADANLEAFDVRSVDAIVTNVAGCGVMLKEYRYHWRDERQGQREEFSAKVRDVHEFLDRLGFVAPKGAVKLAAVYHDACHLAHAQGIREAPRRLLSKVPGLDLLDLKESDMCCGAAGTYNIMQPEMSERLSRRKVKNIINTRADVVIAANAGCLLQIGRGLRDARCKLTVAHPMDLLDRSYRA